MNLNYIIVDPENKKHEIIRDYCNELEYMNLVGQCYNAEETYEILQVETIDIIFLDIKIKKLEGFEFLKTLKKPIKIIVITAKVNDSLEGYEIDISDLMLKPLSLEKLVNSLKKIQTNLAVILSTLKK